MIRYQGPRWTVEVRVGKEEIELGGGSAPSTSTLNRHQPAWSSRDDATNAPSFSGSGCSARVSAEAGSPDRGCAVSDVMRAGRSAAGLVAGRVLGVICTRKTFSSPGRAVIRRRFTQGVSPRKASPAGAARSSAGRRSHRLPAVEEPPACPGGDQREGDRGESDRKPRSAPSRAGRDVVLPQERGVRVCHRVSAGVRHGLHARPVWSRSAGGAAIRSVDRAAIPGVACGTG